METPTTFTFQTQDKYEAKLWMLAGEIESARNEAYNLVRSALKHGEYPEETDKLLEQLREILWVNVD